MSQSEIQALADSLRQRFAAQVEVEPVGGGRYRFAVVSPQFAEMSQLQRQDAVWQVVDQVLSRDATLDVSLILAFAPQDLAPAA